MSSNSKIISKGFALAETLVRDAIIKKMMEAGLELVLHAHENREWQSFTGNTITSYGYGIYEKGRLIYRYISGQDMKDPVRRKIMKGEIYFLEKPYEGGKRRVRGVSNITVKYGEDFTKAFLEDYTPEEKKGFTLVVATGTEYSEYLEGIRELNTLTETYESARRGFVNGIFEKPVL